MDPHEVQQSIQQALKDAEHSVEGANILGRAAADCIARLHILCLQVNENLDIVNGQHSENSLGQGNSRPPGIKTQLKEANERLALIEKQNQIIASANKNLETNAANATQQSHIAEEKAFQAQERVAHLEHLLEIAQARISGLVKQLESPISEAIEQSKQNAARDSLCKALEKSLHSKDAQITDRDAEIAKLKGQLRACDDLSRPEIAGE